MLRMPKMFMHFLYSYFFNLYEVYHKLNDRDLFSQIWNFEIMHFEWCTVFRKIIHPRCSV